MTVSNQIERNPPVQLRRIVEFADTAFAHFRSICSSLDRIGSVLAGQETRNA